MRSFWRRVLILLLLPIVPAWVQSAFVKTPPPAAGAAILLAPKAAREMIATGTEILWVDARTQDEFNRAHLPGAIWLSPGHWPEESLRRLAIGPRDRLVVVYCGGGGCRAAEETAARLARELKLTNLRILQGGFPAWESAP